MPAPKVNVKIEVVKANENVHVFNVKNAVFYKQLSLMRDGDASVVENGTKEATMLMFGDGKVAGVSCLGGVVDGLDLFLGEEFVVGDERVNLVGSDTCVASFVEATALFVAECFLDGIVTGSRESPCSEAS